MSILRPGQVAQVASFARLGASASGPRHQATEGRTHKRLAPFPAEQLVELAHTLRNDANNLAIKDGVLDGQLGERRLECLKSKVPLIARNQLRLAVLQVRDRPETVVFQLENVIGMVDRAALEARVIKLELCSLAFTPCGSVWCGSPSGLIEKTLQNLS